MNAKSDCGIATQQPRWQMDRTLLYYRAMRYLFLCQMTSPEDEEIIAILAEHRRIEDLIHT